MGGGLVRGVIKAERRLNGSCHKFEFCIEILNIESFRRRRIPARRMARLPIVGQAGRRLWRRILHWNFEFSAEGGSAYGGES